MSDDEVQTAVKLLFPSSNAKLYLDGLNENTLTFDDISKNCRGDFVEK